MNSVETLNRYQQQRSMSERTFPVAPFPRKYMHIAFDDLQDAVQAFTALLDSGYDAGNIHLMTGQDFVEAVEHRQTPFGFLSSFDDTVYLHDARRGRHMLSVRPSASAQMKQIRDLLAPYQPCSITYVDTWTLAVLPV